MKNLPVKETETEIVIDKEKVESLSKRFLAAAKAFFIKLVGEGKWKLMGLEKTWRYFLPLVVIVSLCFIQYAAYFLGFATLVVTVVWLWRSRKG